jgi:ABC-type thiamine transport system ATPase subunit
LSELVLQGLVDGPLLGVNARFTPGVSAVLGADAAALAHFVALAAGTRAPRRGVVLVDNGPLHSSPELRRVTAALFADESLPALGSVREALGAIFAARSDGRDPRTLLEAAGLADWQARRPLDLDASERRTVALLVALDHPNPRLVVLYEPLAAARGLEVRFVRDRVARALDAGAVVVVATQSLEDARALGGEPWLLQGGVLANVAGAPLGGPLDGDRTFIVETPDARRFAAALAGDTAVRGVRWDEAHAPDTLFVFGNDTERIAEAIARAASEGSLRTWGVSLSPLPLAALLARPAVPAVAPGGVLQAAPFQPSQAPAYAPPGAYAVPPGPYAALPEQAPPPPPDQSVSMPTTFADPTRRSDGGGS